MSATRGEHRKRETENERPAHEGECGQSRASPVYVDSHLFQSIKADSDVSDNGCFWTSYSDPRGDCTPHAEGLSRVSRQRVQPGLCNQSRIRPWRVDSIRRRPRRGLLLGRRSLLLSRWRRRRRSKRLGRWLQDKACTDERKSLLRQLGLQELVFRPGKEVGIHS